MCKAVRAVFFETVYLRLTKWADVAFVFSWRHPPSPNAFGGSSSPAFFLAGGDALAELSETMSA
jgi:hypothetical protein